MKYIVIIALIGSFIGAMAPEFALDRYQKEDLEPIQDLMLKEEKALFLDDDRWFRFEDLQEAYARISLDEWQTIVMRKNRDFIGFISYEIDNKKNGLIYLLAVEKEYRKKRNATIMLEATIDEMKRQGVRDIYLRVRKDNKPATSLYERKFNFKKIKKFGSLYECLLRIR